MKTCITCGMPLEGNHANDIGTETPDGPVCKFDSENGAIKPPEAIYQGGIEFFSQYTDGDRALAERATRTNMNSLLYWQKHPFAELQGEHATEEEFGTIMQKVM